MNQINFKNSIKRTVDLFVSFFGLIFLLPLLLFISILIKLDSPGPLLYRGRRVGKYGNEFLMYKFRTMTPDAEQFGSTTALNDNRITNLGFVLRKYKLDELPQLLNVLMGNMSLVGPRPEVAEHTNAYTVEESRILTVKPGITDYSSIYFASLTELLGEDNAHAVFVSQYRSKKNLLRLKYVAEQSFFVDTKIIIMTIRAIIKKF